MATPRLSGEELTSLEGRTQLKGGAYLMWLESGEIDGSYPYKFLGGKDYYFDTPSQRKQKTYKQPNLDAVDAQIVKDIGHQLEADGLKCIVQDSELTVFVDSHGNRYARWHHGVPKPSENAFELQFGHLVGKRTGGWLVYRLNFGIWISGGTGQLGVR